jgi:hypothetical protein
MHGVRLSTSVAGAACQTRLGSAEPDINKPRSICSTLEVLGMGQLAYRLITRPLFPVRGLRTPDYTIIMGVWCCACINLQRLVTQECTPTLGKIERERGGHKS